MKNRQINYSRTLEKMVHRLGLIDVGYHPPQKDNIHNFTTTSASKIDRIYVKRIYELNNVVCRPWQPISRTIFLPVCACV
jgi:hypothetical protein